MISKKPFFRHPLFWTLFIISSLAIGLWSSFYFSRALPFVDIELTMDKQQALEKASILAKKYNWGPQEYAQGAFFQADTNVQNYIELELGGLPAWKNFLKQKEFQPYTWAVRHYKEGEAVELYVIFTPDGNPYGFMQIIPDTAPGASLDQEKARALAETFMAQEWKVPLSEYKFIDASNERKLNGRVDHRFVYEKELQGLGDAHYRVSVGVTGDAVTSLSHYIDIPEAFVRKFTHMRAFNDALFSFASILMYLVYLLGGCLFGILFLLHHKWLLTKPALIAGFVLAGLQLLNTLNQLPLLWLSYDTAVSYEAAIFKIFLSLCTSFITNAVLYSATFLAAEGLTRRAFGSHIQLWSAWKLPAASSVTLLGFIVASYLIISFDIGFVLLFYSYGSSVFGLWTPSSSLINPNILSSYVPAFTALINAFTAGFWEESLFRAVPLASAALIGEKFGSRKTGIVVGFIVQALIFGAAHASYPSLPFYARTLELIIPSLGFGIIYLYFGLIPGILVHTFYDALLMSLPLFVLSAEGVWIQRALIIAFCSLPLVMVFIARIKTGHWLELPETFTNASWQPIFHTSPLSYFSHKTQTLTLLSKKNLYVMAGASSIALGLWIFTRHPLDVPPLRVTKSEAISIASKALKHEGHTLTPSWIPLATISQPNFTVIEFVWQEGGKQLFKNLLGTFIPTPGWKVRFAQFSGDLAQRAEEFHVFINENGVPWRIRHIFPEATSSANLKQDDARELALKHSAQIFHEEKTDLQEIKVISETLPNRTDWSFTFTNSAGRALEPLLKGGQAQIYIALAGDALADSKRFIHVPQEWLRKQRSLTTIKEGIATIKQIAWYVLFILMALYAAFIATQNVKDRRKFLWLIISGGSLYACIAAFSAVLTIPAAMAFFSTEKPFFMQFITGAALEGTQIIITSLLMGLAVAVCYTFPVSSPLSMKQTLLSGIGAGLVWAGGAAAVGTIFPSMPIIPSLTGLDNTFPLLASALISAKTFIQTAVLWQFLAFFAGGFRWQKIGALILAALIATPSGSLTAVSQWFIAYGLITLLAVILYTGFLKKAPHATPLALAINFTLFSLEDAYRLSFIGAPFAFFLSSLFCIGLAVLWMLMFHKKRSFQHPSL